MATDYENDHVTETENNMMSEIEPIANNLSDCNVIPACSEPLDNESIGNKEICMNTEIESSQTVENNCIDNENCVDINQSNEVLVNGDNMPDTNETVSLDFVSDKNNTKNDSVFNNESKNKNDLDNILETDTVISVIEAPAESIASEDRTNETSDKNYEDLNSEIESLKQKIAVLNSQLEEKNSYINHQEAVHKKAVANIQSELRLKVDQLSRMFDEAKKEKETMVLKYAQSEQRVIESQKKMKDMENRVREKEKDKELLLNRMKALKQDKERIQNQLNSRTKDYVDFEKEINSLKANVKSEELKVKWHQNKLKEEQDNIKLIQKKLEETSKALQQSKEETDTLRKNCQEIVRTYQESDEIRSNSLASELKQTMDELRIQQVDTKQALEAQRKLERELDSRNKLLKEIQSDLHLWKEKSKCQEAERLCQEEAFNQLKAALKSTEIHKEQLADRVRVLEPLEGQVQRVKNDKESLTLELNELRTRLTEQERELEDARRKESELLQFTQRISDRNAALQAEVLSAQGRLQGLDSLDKEMKDKTNRLEENVNSLTTALNKSRQEWSDQKHKYEEEIKQRTESEAKLRQELEDEKNEIRTLKKKHAANIKDITRQLAQAQKKLEQQSSVNSTAALCHSANQTNLNSHDKHPVSSENLDTISQDSRTSSNNSVEHVYTNQGAPYVASLNAVCDADPIHPEIKMMEPDRQALIDKILRLQKNNARLTEKIDFLQEHVKQLTDDLKKKNRLLQAFLSKIECNSVVPENSDQNKSMIARRGNSIMASVYSSHPADQNITLELSLEINRKLQSVLEDTLLKNITLKENINTLGEEISRLTAQSGTSSLPPNSSEAKLALHS